MRAQARQRAVMLDAVAVAPPRAELWLLEAIAGEPSSGLDECLASGMLTSGAMAFGRHELARLAIEGAIGPSRKVGLHRKALTALAEPAKGVPDLARLPGSSR